MAKTGIVWQRGKSPRDLAAAIERQYGVSKHVAAVGAIARYMEGRRQLIEDGVPYLDFDFESLAVYM